MATFFEIECISYDSSNYYRTINIESIDQWEVEEDYRLGKVYKINLNDLEFLVTAKEMRRLKRFICSNGHTITYIGDFPHTT